MFYVLLKCVESAFLTHTLNGVSTRKLLVSPKYFINTSKSAKKIRFVTCHYPPVAKLNIKPAQNLEVVEKIPIYDYG